MLKANKFLAIIVLFFFAVIMGSCGGGGGGEGSSSNGPTPPPSTGKPIPPPPQTSTTDSSGQVTFLTSQGQTVTFEVKDKETQSVLANISVIFIKTQNNTYIVEFQDTSEEYMQSIGTGSILLDDQQTSLTGTAIKTDSAVQVPITVKILVTLVKTAIFEGTEIYRDLQGISYITKLGEDYNSFGVNKKPECVTAAKYINYLEGEIDLTDQKKKLVVNLGLIFIPGPGWVVIAKQFVSDFLLNPLSNRYEALLYDLYLSRAVDHYPYNEFEEKVVLDSYGLTLRDYLSHC